MVEISVIIPTYQPQYYLWDCLNSLANQTFPKKDFEIILVLNGIKEPYKSNIDSFIAAKMKGFNINFIYTEIKGVSNARNIALDNVKGKYVAFIDDDDFISPNYLKELYKNVNEKVISLCYPYAFNDGDLTNQLQYSLTNVYNKYHNKTNISISTQVRKYFSGPCMKLIPMNFIKNRRFDIRFTNGEDSLFMFLISNKFQYFTFTHQDAIYYRRYRINSAFTRKRNRKDIVKNELRRMWQYTSIYFRAPAYYNLNFYLTRMFGAIKSMFYVF